MTVEHNQEPPVERNGAYALAILDAVAVGVIAIDDTGLTVWNNRYCLKILGLEPDFELIRSRLAERLAELNLRHAEPLLEATRCVHPVESGVLDFVHRSGELRAIRYWTCPLDVCSGHSGLVITLVELGPRATQWDAADSVSSALLVTASHELRQPLHFISLRAALLEYSGGVEEVAAHAREIQAQVGSAVKVLESLFK